MFTCKVSALCMAALFYIIQLFIMYYKILLETEANKVKVTYTGTGCFACTRYFLKTHDFCLSIRRFMDWRSWACLWWVLCPVILLSSWAVAVSFKPVSKWRGSTLSTICGRTIKKGTGSVEVNNPANTSPSLWGVMRNPLNLGPRS